MIATLAGVYEGVNSWLAHSDAIRIHSEIQADFVFAKKLCDKTSGYQIGREEEIHHVFVEF